MVKIALISKLKNWVLGHKLEALLLLIILLVASYMRLYRISDYMTFLGDEGRDVIIVRRFLLHGDLMLIGPGTSIGNMYLGPLYYYMMAPVLFLFGYSPVGPAVQIAVLGVLTTWFVWLAAREWFGSKAGIFAAALYAIAPTVVIYSRSSWNPNIMPFFALLSVWGIWRVFKYRWFKWMPVVGMALASCLQSHYLGLLLVPVLGIFWLLTAIGVWKTSLRKNFILNSLFMILIFLFLMSPLVIFDIRHNFINFNAMKAFFTDRQTTVSIKPWNAIPQIFPQLTTITTRLITGYNASLSKWGSVLFVGVFFLGLKRRGTKGYLILLLWVGFGLLGLALYKQQIYDHYYGFLFPAFFVSAGAVLSFIWEQKWFVGMWLSLTLFLVLVWVNLTQSPLQYYPNGQLPRSIDVSNFILKEAGTMNFNFAVIAERNYEGAYQYFLENDSRFRVIDPQNTKDTITGQLFVVCEMQKEKCDPTHNAKAEVANFGWTKIDESWEVDGTTVFKLGHNYPTK